jgi:hypothetical protein
MASMDKTITIPTNKKPNYEILVNGKKYSYPAGETVLVPEDVAEVIENDLALEPKTDPNARRGDRLAYSEFVEKTVVAEEVGVGVVLEGFPAFKEGDAVALKVNGVELLVVARYEEEAGGAMLGGKLEELMAGKGEYLWAIAKQGSEYVFLSLETPTTLTYKAEKIHPIEEKYLPSGIIMDLSYYIGEDNGSTNVVTFYSGDERIVGHIRKHVIVPKKKSAQLLSNDRVGIGIVDEVFGSAFLIHCYFVDGNSSKREMYGALEDMLVLADSYGFGTEPT